MVATRTTTRLNLTIGKKTNETAPSSQEKRTPEGKRRRKHTVGDDEEEEGEREVDENEERR